LGPLPCRDALPVLLGLAANAAGQSFLLVVLPPLGRRLGFSDMETGAILSVSALLLIVFAPIWGYVSERIGRRKVMLIALSGASLGPAAFSVIVGARISETISAAVALMLLFVSRSVQVVASAGLLPATQAYVADLTAPARRAGGMGLIGAAFGGGVVLGATLAWKFGGKDAIFVFELIAALVAASFAGVFLLVREPVRREAMVSGGRLHSPLARIWPFLAITLLGVTAYGILQQVTALRLQDALGFSSQDSITRAGAALMATALAMVVVQGIALRVVAWAPERLLNVGAVTAAFAMTVATLAQSYAEIFGALVIFGAAIGLMLPGNLAALSLRVSVDAQGKAAGINVIGQGMGQALGPLLGASLHQLSPLAPFFATTILMIAAVVLTVYVSRGRFAASSP
jgi:DHA1 family tetracycline resistance protein-like MFS transporter